LVSQLEGIEKKMCSGKNSFSDFASLDGLCYKSGKKPILGHIKRSAQTGQIEIPENRKYMAGKSL